MDKLTHQKKSCLGCSSCLGLIGCSGKNKSLSNADIKDFLTFIQTIPYRGTIYKSCVTKRIGIYDNEKIKVT